MTDDKAPSAQDDGRRIDLSERSAIIYWTDRFGVSEVELEAAVMKVGSSARAVEDCLVQGKAR